MVAIVMAYIHLLIYIKISNLSKGFSIFSKPLVVICVYISVVLLLEWPNKLWIYLKSVPFSPSNNHSLGLYSLKYFRKTTKVFLGSKVYRSFFPLLCCIFIPFERDVRYTAICIRSLHYLLFRLVDLLQYIFIPFAGLFVM